MLPRESQLDVATVLPEREPRGSLLFVHGAYTDNWCWQPYFLPYFAGRGYAAHALSLRGHGNSGGGDTLFAASLDDFVEDVASVASGLRQPPVLIGHSMGAVIVERALDTVLPPAAVLIAPVPPGGLFAVARDLFAHQPDLLVDFQQLEGGHPTAAALDALRPLYFTDNIAPQLLLETVRHTQAESARALLDLAFRWEAPIRRHRPPLLVVAPELDRLFPPARVRETAARHRTDTVVVPALPHMLMLDDGWESAAEPIADWIDSALALR